MLDHCRVSNRHWSRGNLPDVTIRSAIKHEVADVAQRVRMQRVDTRGWVVRDRAEGVKPDAAIRVVPSTLNDFHRTIQKKPDSFRLNDVVLLNGWKHAPRGASPYALQERKRA